MPIFIGMIKSILLVLPILFFGSGCSINKLIPPPYAGAIVDHERFFGLNAKIPYASSAVVEIQLGWGSHVWVLLPVSTNKVYAAPISDTFRVGADIDPSSATSLLKSLFNTTITEDFVSGFPGEPPKPRIDFSHTNSPSPVKSSPPEVKKKYLLER